MRESVKNARREIHDSGIPGSIKDKMKLLLAAKRMPQKGARNKKMPVELRRAQPKIGPRDAESGAVRRSDAAHLSAITHIGYVYRDEFSIGREYDSYMTLLKHAAFRIERSLLGPV